MKRLVARPLLVAAVLAAFVGCVQQQDPSKQLIGLTVQSTQGSVAKGRTIRPSVKANYSDGSAALVTGKCEWTSIAPDILGSEASPALPGTFRANAEGVATIVTSFEGQQAELSLTVTPHELDALRLNRDAEGALPLGGRLQLSAIGIYSDGMEEDLTATVRWQADGSGAFDDAAPGSLVAKSVGTAKLTAQQGGVQARTTVEVTDAALVRIELTPPALSLAHGTQGSIVATAVFTDGTTVDVSAEASWTSTDEQVLTFSEGLVNAVKPGSTELHATFGGKAAHAQATVTTAALQWISVSPPMISVARGIHTRLTAVGHFTDGTVQNLSAQASWSSTDERIAQLLPVALQGEIAALAVGAAEIHAVVNGHTAAAEVTVTQAQLMTLALPNAVSIAQGNAMKVAATAKYSDSSAADVSSQAIWSSSDPTVATVSSTGVLQGHSMGSATITATFEGLSPQMVVTVTAPNLNSIQVKGAMATLPKGAGLMLTAIGHYSDGHSEDISANVVWGSSNPYVASVSNASGTRGALLALSGGQASISASVGGVIASVLVEVTPAVIDYLELTPTSSNIPLGLAAQLSASAVYSDGTSVSIASLATWSSSSPAVAQVSATGSVQSKGMGTAVITVEYANHSASVYVQVTSPVLLGVTISQGTLTLPLGVQESLVMKANYSDGASDDVTAQAVWASSDETVATVAANGGVTPVAQGDTVISATWNGEVVTSQVKITPPAIVSVKLEPSGASLFVGDSLVLVARATFTDGSTANVSDQTQWMSTDSNVAAIYMQSAGPVLTANAPGTAEVRATVQGFLATALVTVQ